MKQSGSCPKCGDTPVLFVPQIWDRQVSNTGTEHLSVHTTQTGWQKHMFGGYDTAGKLQVCVCLKCGFTEFYTENPREIPIKDVPGATLIWSKDSEEDARTLREIMTLRRKKPED